MKQCPNVIPPAVCVDPDCAYCQGMYVRRLGKKLVKRVGYCHVPTYAHWCPGCCSMHDFAVDKPFANSAKWSFDGNVEAPSFLPSMHITIGPFSDGRKDVCHYFLKAGQIQFLNDCTHKLAGQTIVLPDVPSEALRWATIKVD